MFCGMCKYYGYDERDSKGYSSCELGLGKRVYSHDKCMLREWEESEAEESLVIRIENKDW